MIFVEKKLSTYQYRKRIVKKDIIYLINFLLLSPSMNSSLLITFIRQNAPLSVHNFLFEQRVELGTVSHFCILRKLEYCSKLSHLIVTQAGRKAENGNFVVVIVMGEYTFI